MKHAGVIGGGAWGTALAQVCARAGLQVTFALLYAHKKVGIIPDAVLNLGRADDSSVVRGVLIQNEKAFAIYAASQDLEWAKVTSQP